MSNNQIIPEDIHAREDYKNIRAQLRKEIVDRKKKRRVDIGPNVTLYFENKDTIIHQINEMVFIENGGKEQILEEIDAYKSLIPNGKELIATVMVEIDNPTKRAQALLKMPGFDETFHNKFDHKIIQGKPELDVDRTTADGKASSVQFVHFHFSEEDIKSFRSENSRIEISINHVAYTHATTLQDDTKNELVGDFK